MSSEGDRHAFIILLRDGDDAGGLARLLDDVRLDEAAGSAEFLAPEVRGKAFFEDQSKQAELDGWWAEKVADRYPVFLLSHEEGLAEWLTGLDGLKYVGIPDNSAAAAYAQVPDCKTFVAKSVLDFATMVMSDFSALASFEPPLFDENEALRMRALSQEFPSGEEGEDEESAEDHSASFGARGTPVPPFPTPPWGAGAPPGFAPGSGFPGQAPAGFPGVPPGAPGQRPMPPGMRPGMSPADFGPPATQPRRGPPPEPSTPNPFDLIADAGTEAPSWNEVAGNDVVGREPIPGAPPAPPAPPARPAPPAPPTSGWQSAPAPFSQQPGYFPSTANAPASKSRFSLPFSLGWQRKGWQRRDFVETPPRELARMVIERGPSIIAMGSRKGGVGKTSYAAGVAIAVGQILDSVGHKAVLVDANIANPDAWGQMDLHDGAATVREVIAALTQNQEPPMPVHAQSPALAVYPESRQASEYSRTDIKRFADYLRKRYDFIVVDMSNRLPDPLAGPEAAAAAYWLEESDVLVLPTTSSKQDFNGVLDFLDVSGLPPVVVPYIVPDDKRNRDHPVTQQYLSVIRQRTYRIVDIPDEADNVRFALMEGVPVERVSPNLRKAYRELLEVLVRAPARVRG